MLGKSALTKNFNLIIFLIAALLLSSLWLFVWQHVDNEKERTLQDASREAMNLAKAFEAQVRNIIARADDEMKLIKMAYEQEGSSSAIVKQILSQAVKDPTRFQLGITNEHGIFVVSSDVRTQGVDYSDREWFRRQRSAIVDQLVISKTVDSRASGKAVIPLSRRINKPDGSFGGVIHTSLDMGYFANIFTKLEMSSGSLISLNGTDGTIRFRQFENHYDYGQNIRGGEIWKQVQSSASGSRIAYGVSDGVTRLFSYRVMPDYPLFIVVASPSDVVMRPFERNKTDYIYGATGLSLVIVALAFLLIDRSRKQRAAEQRLRRDTEIQTVLREIAESSLMASSQNELYAAFYQVLKKILPGINLTIALLDEINDQIVVPYYQAENFFLPQHRSKQKGLTEYALRQNQTVWLKASDIARLHDTGEVELKFANLHQWLSAPLRDAQGKQFGVFSLSLLHEQDIFPDDIVEITNVIATQLSIALERRKAEAAFIASKLQRANEIQQDAVMAARVQKALLSSPTSSEYLEIAEVYQPNGYIGSDLYFVDWRYDGNLLRGFLIDAAGHGIATALHTASLHVLLREINQQDLPLPATMRWLNKKVAEYFDESTLVGALGFEFDLQTRVLRWTCAGIPGFWLATQSKQGVVQSPGMCLGIDPEETFEMCTMPIEIGDSFYFVTDEMHRLLQAQEDLPLARFTDMVGLLKKLSANETLTDDATAVCITVSALPQSPVRRDGWPRIIRFHDYGDYQRFKGEVGKILAEVTGKVHSMQEVAVHEALANAMECRDGVPRQHRARVRFNKVGQRLIVRIKTSRIGFAGNAVLRRLKSQPEQLFSFGEDAGMGRGIPIMLSTSQKMTYNNDGTELLLMWDL